MLGSPAGKLDKDQGGTGIVSLNRTEDMYSNGICIQFMINQTYYTISIEYIHIPFLVHMS